MKMRHGARSSQRRVSVPCILTGNQSLEERTFALLQAISVGKPATAAATRRALSSKLGGSKTRAARLAFPGGAFTPPLTKGVAAPPLETPARCQIHPHPLAGGDESGSS